jgi:5'-nucleotidase
MLPCDNAEDITKKPFDRILITNDDGIDAPGLAELEAIARQLSDDVWIFAPDDNKSGAGRSLTISREVKVTEHGDNKLSCDGTPTDCIILALNEFMKDCRPDLVLSGINRGMNVADDITCSGTIGAAWEAVVHDVPAIALSQKTDRRVMDLDNPDVFHAARHHAVDVIRLLAHQGWPEQVVMNINFPSYHADEVKGIKAVHVGRHKEADDVVRNESDDDYYQIGMWRLRDGLDPQSDIGALLDGYIAVCPLSLNMTDQKAKSSLSQLSDISLPSSGRRSA